MPSANELYGTTKIEASMLPHGQDVPVTIAGVAPRTFDDGTKLELAFRGTERVLVLNLTNMRSIVEQLGDNYETWVGKRIALYRTRVDFQGKRVDAIRVADPPAPVRPPVASASAAAVMTGAKLHRQQQQAAPAPPSDPGGFRAETEQLGFDDRGGDLPF